MSKKTPEEIKSSQINEIAENITPEYWPHDLFSDENRYQLVAPMHFYNNLKCLIATTDPYLDDEEYGLIEKIEVQVFRFFLWLNNNSFISEDYYPISHPSNSIKEQIGSLAYEIYLRIAPVCYNVMNQKIINKKYNKQENEELKDETIEHFQNSFNRILEIVDSLPKESEEDLKQFSLKGIEIIIEQR